MKQEPFEIEFKELFYSIIRRWYIVVLIVLASAFGLVYLQGEPVQTYYQVSTRIIIGNSIDQEGRSYNIQDLQVYQNYMNTYITMLKTDMVIDATVEALDFNVSASDIRGSVYAAAEESTQFLDITLNWPDRNQSAAILETLTETFIAEMKTIYPAINLRLMDRVKEPVMRVVGIPRRNTFIKGGLMGGIISLLVVFAIEFLDKTIKDEKEIEGQLGSYMLTSVPKQNGKEKTIDLSSKLLLNTPFMEAYRRLQANLDFLSINKQIKSVVITSSKAHEGKSTTAAMLAVSLALTGKKTLLIDGDLRNSSLKDIFNIQSQQGLVDVLLSNAPLQQAIISGGMDNLYMLQAGTQPINPVEILFSKKMKILMEELQKVYEYIIIDTPPIGVAADAQILSRYVDGVMLVASYRKTQIKELEKAKELIEHVNGRVLGVVVNKKTIPVKDMSGSYFCYLTKKFSRSRKKSSITIRNSQVLEDEGK